jgi:hypothetical protein
MHHHVLYGDNALGSGGKRRDAGGARIGHQLFSAAPRPGENSSRQAARHFPWSKSLAAIGQKNSPLPQREFLIPSAGIPRPCSRRLTSGNREIFRYSRNYVADAPSEIESIGNTSLLDSRLDGFPYLRIAHFSKAPMLFVSSSQSVFDGILLRAIIVRGSVFVAG